MFAQFEASKILRVKILCRILSFLLILAVHGNQCLAEPVAVSNSQTGSVDIKGLKSNNNSKTSHIKDKLDTKQKSPGGATKDLTDKFDWVYLLLSIFSLLSGTIGMAGFVYTLIAFKDGRKLNSDLNLLSNSVVNNFESVSLKIDHSVDNLMDTVDKLSSHVSIIRDATRKPLDNFEEIFCYSYRMLDNACDDLIYVNYVCGFGEPHKKNKQIISRFPDVAKHLNVPHHDYAKAVDAYFALLIRRIEELNSVKMTFLTDSKLKENFYSKLYGEEYNPYINDLLESEEKRRERLISHARWSDFPMEMEITTREQIPWQLLICRTKSVLDDRVTNCGLIFLIGDANVGEKPHGFYTEIDDHLELHKTMGEWLVKSGQNWFIRPRTHNA